MNKKTRQHRLHLRKETLAQLTRDELAGVAGAAIKSQAECSNMCSRVQGSCLSCGPTFCP